MAVQDVRGRYDSEGEFYIYVNEAVDGYDALEWVAAQSWCNGDVGTYGGSYLAATQNALAVLNPPHLRTMFVYVGTSNYVEDGTSRGGAFALLHNLAYGVRLAQWGKEARSRDPDEEEDSFSFAASTTRNAKGRLQSGGKWKTARSWPSPGLRERKFFLGGDGSLRQNPGETETSSRFEYDPRNPVPTIGGNIDSGKLLVRRGAQNQVPEEGDFAARDQLPLSARSDVLSFQTPPLMEAVEIAGPLRVELWVSSTARDTDFTAKLMDIYPPSADYPEGYAMNLEDGILRARFRNSREREELMEPGTVYRIEIDLWATANRFAPGHRIRLDISSSNFPFYDVNPNTGERLGAHTHMKAAINTVYRGPRHPSALVLPVVHRGEGR